MIREKEPIGWDFYFVVSHECAISKLVDTRNIKFKRVTENNGERLLGYNIRVDESDKVLAEMKAKGIARILSNLISVLSGMYVGAHLHGWNEIRQDGNTKRVGVQLAIGPTRFLKSFDFDLKEKMQIMLDSADVHEHASNALRAYDIGHSSTVIRELFQIIDSKNLSNLKNRYEPLRDVLSHSTPIKQETVRKLRDSFGLDYFVLTSKETFDYTSSQNNERLYNEANSLLNIIIPLLRKALSQ